MRLGWARTIYVRRMYGIFGREIPKYMFIHGVCNPGQPYIFTYMRCIHCTFCRVGRYEDTKHTVILGVHVWLWSTLHAVH